MRQDRINLLAVFETPPRQHRLSAYILAFQSPMWDTRHRQPEWCGTRGAISTYAEYSPDITIVIRYVLFASCFLWCLFGNVARAEEPYHTPLAGAGFTTTVFGHKAVVPARDRTNLTAINLGLQGIPDYPGEKVAGFGALYMWRVLDDGKTRFRGIMDVVYDDLRYSTKPSFLGGAEMVLTFHNFTVPVAQSEYVEGVEIDDPLYWYEAQLGVGLGASTKIAPGHDDNFAEVALTYEPGFLVFRKAADHAPTFSVPGNVYEGRVHLRARADAMTRNVMELAHHGLSGGMDVVYGNRPGWDSWGGTPAFGTSGGASHRNWLTASAYAVAAGGVPFVQDQHHRLIARLHAGVGSHIDRFSGLRLSGGPVSDEVEDLARPVLQGSAFNEYFTDAYAITSLEYRYEVLFFFYLHFEGDVAWVDRYRFTTSGTGPGQGINGPASYEFDMIPSVTTALTTGFIWNSELEVFYTHSFGILRDMNGNPTFGGDAVVVSWAREF
jgi:hypothetical protein